MTALNMRRRSQKKPRRLVAMVAAEPAVVTIAGPGEARVRPPPAPPASLNDNSFGGGATAEVARADDPAAQVNEVIAAQIAEFDDVGRRTAQLVEAAARKLDAREDLRVALDQELGRLRDRNGAFVELHTTLDKQISE